MPGVFRRGWKCSCFLCYLWFSCPELATLMVSQMFPGHFWPLCLHIYQLSHLALMSSVPTLPSTRFWGWWSHCPPLGCPPPVIYPGSKYVVDGLTPALHWMGEYFLGHSIACQPHWNLYLHLKYLNIISLSHLQKGMHIPCLHIFLLAV